MTEQLPTHDEALRMLAAKAREGSVTAIVHLERLLRTQKAEQTRVRRCLIRGLRSQPGSGAISARLTRRRVGVMCGTRRAVLGSPSPSSCSSAGSGVAKRGRHTRATPPLVSKAVRGRPDRVLGGPMRATTRPVLHTPLLRQPGGFAGSVFLVVQVDLDPRYQTVLVKGPNGPSQDIQLDPAGRPSGHDELSPQDRPLCDHNGFKCLDHLLFGT